MNEIPGKVCVGQGDASHAQDGAQNDFSFSDSKLLRMHTRD